MIIWHLYALNLRAFPFCLKNNPYRSRGLICLAWAVDVNRRISTVESVMCLTLRPWRDRTFRERNACEREYRLRPWSDLIVRKPSGHRCGLVTRESSASGTVKQERLTQWPIQGDRGAVTPGSTFWKAASFNEKFSIFNRSAMNQAN